MREKQKNRLTILLLGGFVIVFAIACVIKKPQAISLSERRKLAMFPPLTMQSIQSGKFMQDFDLYSVDQFPFRDQFMQLYSFLRKDVLQQKDIDGLYIHEGNAIAMEYPLQLDSLQHATNVFNAIYRKHLTNANQVYYSIIPDKSYFLTGSEYLTMDYEALVKKLQQQLSAFTYIDIMPSLELSDYYQSDPHWRAERIIDVARVLGEKMGVSIDEDYEVIKVDEPFYGSYYGRLAHHLQPEAIYYVSNSTIENYSVYDHQNQRNIEVYDFEKVKGKDAYEMYLSGPLSYLTIENPKAKGNRELVVFRDSFASSLAPLLATAYAKVELVDIRYLPSSMLGKYIDFTNKDVLFLYSTSLCNHSETLK